jgi:hypothetical protein
MATCESTPVCSTAETPVFSNGLARGPSFIIAGGPKCGTTAIYQYLSTHPRIFLTTPKEPHFYADDLGTHREVQTRSEYERLFRQVTAQHQAIGEASVCYMHSKVALPKVRAEFPDVKLIVVLRQPIDFLRSFHSDLVWICFEDEPDFEKAWHLQDERRAGRRIPPLCQVPWFLAYRELGQLSRHLARLLSVFPREQTKILLFDDFKESPQAIYESILQFIGVESDGRQDFPRVNAGKQSRLSWLARTQATIVQSLPRSWIQFGKRVGLGKMSRAVRQWNSRPNSPPPMRREFREHLLDEFSSDIDALSELLQRDLSHWKKKGTGPNGIKLSRI